MINGVDVNDNLFAEPAEPVRRGRHRETQVLTSASRRMAASAAASSTP
jgi:hypothetical protein